MTTTIAADRIPEITDEEFALFRELIHKETGIFLKEGKRALLISRLTRRLRHLRLATLREYHSYLMRQDPGREELRQMVNCITTNKTSFFREEHHFRFLREWLASKSRRGDRRLRVWSAACSTGEESYSIAITVAESLDPSAWDVAILGSDIDTEVLERAEAGIYEASSLDSISDHLRRKYFLRGKGEWEGFVQVKPELRRMTVFRHINLVEGSWPIQARFDAIFCRNVIIYFDRPTQRRLFERLLSYLAPDGYLFVGHSESLFWLTDLVAPVQHTVYRLREGAQR